MPENAGRFAAVLYDQFEEDRVADWGGDDLFTRMPSPRPVDDAPAPRFRRTLTLVEAPEERRYDGQSEHAPATLARDNRTGPGDRRAPARSISGPLRAEPTTR